MVNDLDRSIVGPVRIDKELVVNFADIYSFLNSLKVSLVMLLVGYRYSVRG